MRATGLCAAILGCLIFSLLEAQDVHTAHGETSEPSTFTLAIVELEARSSGKTAEDVIQLAQQSGGTNRRRRLFRLSAVEGIGAFAQFAETVPTVVGKTIHDGKTIFDYEDTRVGTTLRVTVRDAGENQVQVDLSLATSAVSLKDDGVRRDLSTLSANLIEADMELGRPTLLKTKATGRASDVVLTVTKRDVQ